MRYLLLGFNRKKYTFLVSGETLPQSELLHCFGFRHSTGPTSVVGAIGESLAADGYRPGRSHFAQARVKRAMMHEFGKTFFFVCRGSYLEQFIMYIDFSIELQEFVMTSGTIIRVTVVDSGKYAVSVDGLLHMHQHHDQSTYSPRLGFPRGKLAIAATASVASFRDDGNWCQNYNAMSNMILPVLLLIGSHADRRRLITKVVIVLVSLSKEYRRGLFNPRSV